LHQANLAISARLPRAEVGLFVHDAPDEIRIDAIDRGLASDQRIEAMSPVLIEEIARDDQSEDYESNGKNSFHPVRLETCGWPLISSLK
jgi:hypothetical protein